MILVKTFYAFNELRNFTYLVTDDESGNSWVIDPFDSMPVIDYIKKNGLVLKGILNTHQHYDHIRGNALLAETFKAPINKLMNTERIHLADKYCIETINTPGHTMDHQVFIWKEEEKSLALFSGDTLFNSGVGNCSSGGDVNELFKTTMSLINTLPDSTLLYPGHDYRKRNLEFAVHVEPENNSAREALNDLPIASYDLPAANLGLEKKVNPFLRLESDELRQNLLKTTRGIPEDEINKREIFKNLRALRDQW